MPGCLRERTRETGSFCFSPTIHPLIISSSSAVYPGIVTTKGGDVVLLVMPGISVVYVGPVLEDGEGLDVIKERFTATPAMQALTEAQAITRQTGGRILKWMRGATEPDIWLSDDQKSH